MGNPTTRNSTPPQSARIGQPKPSGAVVLQGYADNAFPDIAFIGQLAIDLSSNTLVFYDANGAWQGVLGAANVQSFYGPVAPTSGMNNGDRWYDTASGLWNTWDASIGSWIPGTAAYSDTAPASPTIGQAWFDVGTGVLLWWNGTAWVPGTDPSAPQAYLGVFPNAATAGSVWTDSHGVQFICITSYTAGTGTMSDWAQQVLANDPLAALIAANGQLIQAQEATPPPSPSPSTSVPITSGLVWLDITQGSTALGNYYVWTGTQWQLVTAPSTLVMCAGLKISQNAPGIVGTNLNYIWPDPLAALITLNSIYATGTGSANVSATGPAALNTPCNVANISTTPDSNTANAYATMNVGTTLGFVPGRQIVVTGANVGALNNTWTISSVFAGDGINANTAQIVFATPGQANLATQDVASPIVTEPFIIGDVGEDIGADEWFIWDTNVTTGTWADWIHVTDTSTIAMCATVGTQNLPGLISDRCIDVGNDIATGQTQNIPADLNAALNDLLAYASTQFEQADPALANYAVASGSYFQNSVLYFVGADEPVLSNVGTLGTSLMNTYAPLDVQTLISVTDSGWTGTATKIQTANFLAEYQTGRAGA